MNPLKRRPAIAHPIDNIVWRDATELKANLYNPNFVMGPELRLIERNILKLGWMQPILVTPDDVIIDGYHRVMLVRDRKKLRDEIGGKVPTAVIDCEPWFAMILTVRINRAKGTHAAVRMADIVKQLVDVHGLTVEQIMAELGMPKREVELLYEDSIFVTKGLDKAPYSKAWIPKDTKYDEKPADS